MLLYDLVEVKRLCRQQHLPADTTVFVKSFDYRLLADHSALLVLLCSNDSFLLFLLGGSTVRPCTAEFKPVLNQSIACCCVGTLADSNWLFYVDSASSHICIISVWMILGKNNETVHRDSVVAQLFCDSEITEINITCRKDGLGLPTCLTTFESQQTDRAYLLLGNKGGDVSIVDLFLKQITMCIQAAQSVCSLVIISDCRLDYVYLLIKGIFGTEWLMPLEKSGQSVRETLSELILPNDLRELSSCSVMMPLVVSGSHCIGIFDRLQERLQIFNTVELKNVVTELSFDVGVSFESDVFAFSEQMTFLANKDSVYAFLNHACRDKPNTTSDKFVQLVKVEINGVDSSETIDSGFFAHDSLLGLIPLPVPSSVLPECLLVCSFGLFQLQLRPNAVSATIENLLLPIVHVNDAKLFCSALSLDFNAECKRLITSALNLNLSSSALQLCELAKMNASEVLRFFVDAGHASFILPKLHGWLIADDANVEDEIETAALSAELFRLIVQTLTESVDKESLGALLKDFLLNNVWYDPLQALLGLMKHDLFWAVKRLLEIHRNIYFVALEQIVLRHDRSALLKNADVIDIVLCHRFCDIATVRADIAQILTESFALNLPLFNRTQLLDLADFFSANKPTLQRLSEEQPNLAVYMTTVYVKVLLALSLSSEENSAFVVKSTTPTLPPFEFIPLACGMSHGIGIAESGVGVFCWGSVPRETVAFARNHNEDGDNGELKVANVNKAAVAPNHPPDGKTAKCTVIEEVSKDGFESCLPIKIRWNSPLQRLKMVQVACGAGHSLCSSTEGRLFAFGMNRFGQLGVGDKINRHQMTEVFAFNKTAEQLSFLKIACGQYHSVAVAISFQAFSWGWSVHRQLGHSRLTDDVTSPKVVDFFVDKRRHIVDVACGYAHSLFLTPNELFACGCNSYGSLGQGNTSKLGGFAKIKFALTEKYKVLKIASAFFHNLALLESMDDLRLFTWGISPQTLKMKGLLQKRATRNRNNAETRDSDDGSTANAPASVFNAGEHVTCLLASAAEDKSHLRPASVDISMILANVAQRKPLLCGEKHDVPIKQLLCGSQHSALLDADGRLYAWGKGLDHQLGFPDKKERAVPSLVPLSLDYKILTAALGADHGMAVVESGLVFGWGRNERLQLGFRSVPSERRSRMAGKTITIQKGPNRSQRIIQLPVDSCLCVTKPKRLAGVRLSSKPHSPTTAQHRRAVETNLSVASLMEQLAELAHFVDQAELVEYSVARGCPLIGAWTAFLRGNLISALELHLLVLFEKRTSCETDVWKLRVERVIRFYTTHLPIAENAALKAEFLALIFSKLSLLWPNIENFVLSDVFFWLPGLMLILAPLTSSSSSGRNTFTLMQKSAAILPLFSARFISTILSAQLEKSSAAVTAEQQSRCCNHTIAITVDQSFVPGVTTAIDRSAAFLYIFACGHQMTSLALCEAVDRSSHDAFHSLNLPTFRQTFLDSFREDSDAPVECCPRCCTYELSDITLNFLGGINGI